ncbi:MAG: glycosyltransferase family 4 protein [Methanoregula sp.]|jgi:glycosyltransferase involved in cell wall biosynthesis|uniref:glycosyltransferase family 4 protein n=1 Tax=Methanoregula sp. TaxID=2052170 RepID=UPI0025D7FE59|nr:glycosyltransferase family 4 protein [Methanoregula sp.]MCK9631745.1 glycosyltransferase family 4 protein [Methanoregula sp.]
MKIAFVYDVIYPYVKGGVEKRVWELATRLTARGHEVHIFGMKFWDGDDVRVQDGVILHGVCPAKKLYVHGRRSVWEALYFGMHLICPLAKERFDIIDCQQFPYIPCIPVRLISIIHRIPLVITWHEVWGDYWEEYLGFKGVFGKATERYIASFGSPVIAVSSTTASRFRKEFGRQPDRIIPNGIDLAHLESVPPSPANTDIIFTGRLIKEKNAGLLIDALTIMISDEPDLTLTIIGDGPEGDTIRSQVRDLSLEKNVTITGFLENHDEVIALMKSSKVFVLPSTREGFGIAALEALGCGLPVVTIDHPANAVCDLITGETGVICPPTPEDLAIGIRKALRHHEQMRDACRAAAEGYDWDRIVDQAEHYYQSLIDHRIT